MARSRKSERREWALKTIFVAGLVILTGSVGLAMPVKSTTLKTEVSLVDADNRPLQALDLKKKSFVIDEKSIEECGLHMVRLAQTLNYTCSVEIPLKSKVSRLKALKSAKTLDTTFAGVKRQVTVGVTDDARMLTLTTNFDVTGLDLELSKFNDDFYAVFAQVAHLIISDAARSRRVEMEVLEGR
ncbi:MAG: hypothetical protein AB7F86_13790 [Bdellovibrionales bacterium]